MEGGGGVCGSGVGGWGLGVGVASYDFVSSRVNFLGLAILTPSLTVICVGGGGGGGLSQATATDF